MLRPRIAVVIVAALAVAVIVIVGWVGIKGDDTSATLSLPPTVVSTPTTIAPIRVSATSAVTPLSNPSTAPTRAATPVNPDPGPATLASGVEMQNGKRGYAYWCANDALGTCGIFDRYGGPVPFEMLQMPPGGTLAFVYRGTEPISAITSLVYSLVGAGAGEYPTLRGGMPLPTTQTDRQATITAPAMPGEYVIIVRISSEKNTTADFQSHILVR